MPPNAIETDVYTNGNNATSSKGLDLKVIGLNCGTSVDGVDCVHVHYTQEHPDAPLKMELLNYDEGISHPVRAHTSPDAT
jgi:1,6-anhydro-N-acetylmuramate kinase